MKKNYPKISVNFLHAFVHPSISKHQYTLSIIGTIILIAIIFFNVTRTVWHHQTLYTSHDYWQRFPELKKTYYNSIYANKHGIWIPDETIYAFSGGALIKGESPILINPEVPPIGKYLIGLSALLFNNENIIILSVSLASLAILFLLGKQIFSSTLLALLAPALFSVEPIFLNQLIYVPLLDIIHLLFLLLSFYFFNKAFLSKKNTFLYFLATMVSFGLFISTKFFGVGFPVIAAFYAVLLYNKDFGKIIKLSLSLPFAVGILLLSYIRVLELGYPFHKFLGIQRWVLWYNQGHVRSQFSVWPLLFFNKWHVSWSPHVITDAQWNLTWPFLGTLSLFTCIAYLLKLIPKKKEAEILIAWIVLYLAFLSIGDADSRYFVILFPLMYIIAVFGAYHVMKGLLKSGKPYQRKQKL